MKNILGVFLGLLLIGLGVAVGAAWYAYENDGFPKQWFGLVFPKKPSGEYIYSTSSYADESERGEIPIPAPLKLEGRAKFVSEGERAKDESRPLGYELTATLQPMSQMAVPFDVTNVECSVSFEFILKDKDGFVLDTLSWDEYDRSASKTVSMSAGETHTFKGVTGRTVKLANAEDVALIECGIDYDSVHGLKSMSKNENTTILNESRGVLVPLLEEMGYEIIERR
jgi:hypothetical protein